MISLIRRLPPTAELILINLICFGPFIGMSLRTLLRGGKEYIYDDRELLTIVAIELACGLIAAWILRVRGWKFSDFGPGMTMPQMIGGFALMFAAQLAIVSLSLLVEKIAGREVGSHVKFVATASQLSVIALVLVNPLYEEFFEVAYNARATESEGAAFAITFSAAIRFFCHLYHGALASVTILPLGIIFAAVYWRWRRLWPLVVAHGVVDLVGLWPEG